MLHSPRHALTSENCSRNRSRAVGCLLLLLLLGIAPQPLQAQSGRRSAVSRTSKTTPKSADAAPPTIAATPGSEDCLEVTECRQNFESARRLSESHQYNAALTAYEKAYSLRASSWLLINIGRVQQKLGRPSDAVVSFKHFLADAEHQPAEAVEAAREYLKQAESDLAGARLGTQMNTPKTEEKPVYKKWWFWLAVGGATAAAAAAIAVGVTLGTAGPAEPARAPLHIAF